jgi:hypothetical protein
MVDFTRIVGIAFGCFLDSVNFNPDNRLSKSTRTMVGNS